MQHQKLLQLQLLQLQQLLVLVLLVEQQLHVLLQLVESGIIWLASGTSVISNVSVSS